MAGTTVPHPALVRIEGPRSTDPAFNLALEEYCLMNLPIDRGYLLLYVNGPSIVIGKHQNAVEEINTDFIEDHQTPVLRRQSGGGTVYHDLGNLNFSFIRRYEPAYFNNYDHFTGLVVEALQRMRVPATLNERGDIYVDGRKVSGNAQAVRRERMVSHGTLLFRADLAHVSEALRLKPGRITSRGRPSVRARVTNIGGYLPGELGMDDFRALLLSHLPCRTSGVYTLAPGEVAQVEALAESRYRSWEWNYGRSPAFDLQRSQPFPGGDVTVEVRVDKGIIEQVRFHGRFTEPGRMHAIVERLTGTRYRRDDIRQVFAAHAHDAPLEGAPTEAWARLLY